MYSFGPIEALGTHWWVEIHDTMVDQSAVAHWLNRRLSTFNDTYSRFDTNSVVGRLNAHRVVEGASDEFLELIARAQHWCQQTNGQFNVLTGAKQVTNGYGKTETIPVDAERTANPQTDLAVTSDTVTLHAGALDLGGFAKGWLIDRIAAELQQQFQLQHVLVNGGGDMFATSLPNNDPCTIAVAHPTKTATYIAEIPLHNQAFAASSTYLRQWQKDGTIHHHLLAPNGSMVVAAANHIVTTTAEAADVYATVGCLDPNMLTDIEGIEYCYLPETGPAHISPGFRNWLLK